MKSHREKLRKITQIVDAIADKVKQLATSPTAAEFLELIGKDLAELGKEPGRIVGRTANPEILALRGRINEIVKTICDAYRSNRSEFNELRADENLRQVMECWCVNPQYQFEGIFVNKLWEYKFYRERGFKENKNLGGWDQIPEEERAEFLYKDKNEGWLNLTAPDGGSIFTFKTVNEGDIRRIPERVKGLSADIDGLVEDKKPSFPLHFLNIINTPGHYFLQHITITKGILVLHKEGLKKLSKLPEKIAKLDAFFIEGQDKKIQGVGWRSKIDENSSELKYYLFGQEEEPELQFMTKCDNFLQLAQQGEFGDDCREGIKERIKARLPGLCEDEEGGNENALLDALVRLFGNREHLSIWSTCYNGNFSRETKELRQVILKGVKRITRACEITSTRPAKFIDRGRRSRGEFQLDGNTCQIWASAILHQIARGGEFPTIPKNGIPQRVDFNFDILQFGSNDLWNGSNDLWNRFCKDQWGDLRALQVSDLDIGAGFAKFCVNLVTAKPGLRNYFEQIYQKCFVTNLASDNDLLTECESMLRGLCSENPYSKEGGLTQHELLYKNLFTADKKFGECQLEADVKDEVTAYKMRRAILEARFAMLKQQSESAEGEAELDFIPKEAAMWNFFIEFIKNYKKWGKKGIGREYMKIYHQLDEKWDKIWGKRLRDSFVARIEKGKECNYYQKVIWHYYVKLREVFKISPVEVVNIMFGMLDTTLLKDGKPWCSDEVKAEIYKYFAEKILAGKDITREFNLYMKENYGIFKKYCKTCSQNLGELKRKYAVMKDEEEIEGEEDEEAGQKKTQEQLELEGKVYGLEGERRELINQLQSFRLLMGCEDYKCYRDVREECQVTCVELISLFSERELGPLESEIVRQLGLLFEVLLKKTSISRPLRQLAPGGRVSGSRKWSRNDGREQEHAHFRNVRREFARPSKPASEQAQAGFTVQDYKKSLQGPMGKHRETLNKMILQPTENYDAIIKELEEIVKVGVVDGIITTLISTSARNYYLLPYLIGRTQISELGKLSIYGKILRGLLGKLMEVATSMEQMQAYYDNYLLKMAQDLGKYRLIFNLCSQVKLGHLLAKERIYFTKIETFEGVLKDILEYGDVTDFADIYVKDGENKISMLDYLINNLSESPDQKIFKEILRYLLKQLDELDLNAEELKNADEEDVFQVAANANKIGLLFPLCPMRFHGNLISAGLNELVFLFNSIIVVENSDDRDFNNIINYIKPLLPLLPHVQVDADTGISIRNLLENLRVQKTTFFKLLQTEQVFKDFIGFIPRIGIKRRREDPYGEHVPKRPTGMAIGPLPGGEVISALEVRRMVMGFSLPSEGSEEKVHLEMGLNYLKYLDENPPDEQSKILQTPTQLIVIDEGPGDEEGEEVAPPPEQSEPEQEPEPESEPEPKVVSPPPPPPPREEVKEVVPPPHEETVERKIQPPPQSSQDQKLLSKDNHSGGGPFLFKPVKRKFDSEKGPGGVRNGNTGVASDGLPPKVRKKQEGESPRQQRLQQILPIKKAKLESMLKKLEAKPLGWQSLIGDLVGLREEYQQIIEELKNVFKAEPKDTNEKELGQRIDDLLLLLNEDSEDEDEFEFEDDEEDAEDNEEEGEESDIEEDPGDALGLGF